MKKFLSILTVLLFVFAFSGQFAKASGPTALLTTPGGGISSISGTPAGTGTEAGVHTITISDATVSTVVSNDIEGGEEGTVAVSINDDNDDMTIVIAGKTLVIDVADTEAEVTLLSNVAADLQTKINAALVAQGVDLTVTVAVTGSTSAQTLLITVGKAGLSNTITSITGSAATALGFTNTPVPSADAKAVDVFVPATGSNGLWVTANSGSTKTISHTTDPGTASTLAGLKPIITAADAFINGVTLAADGNISAGAPVITVARGNAGKLEVSAPTIGYTYTNFNPQPVVKITDDAGNVVATDGSQISIEAYTDIDTETGFGTGTPLEFIGDTTIYATSDGSVDGDATGIATFSGIKYNTINTNGIYLCAWVDDGDGNKEEGETIVGCSPSLRFMLIQVQLFQLVEQQAQPLQPPLLLLQPLLPSQPPPLLLQHQLS